MRKWFIAQFSAHKKNVEGESLRMRLGMCYQELMYFICAPRPFYCLNGDIAFVIKQVVREGPSWAVCLTLDRGWADIYDIISTIIRVRPT